MKPNRELFAQWLRQGVLRLQRGAIFEQPVAPKTAALDFDKVEGMLLGLAVGDALGFPTESVLPGQRRADYGEIRDYLGGQGLPSDDTQLAFWTLEQMLQDGGFVPERVAARFCRGYIFGLGRTVRAFLRCHKDEGRPWWQCGQPSAGNGALMRIAPILLPHLRRGGTDLWVDAVLCTAITHNDPLAFSTSVAFVAMLWALLDMQAPPPATWWVDTYVRIARTLEGTARYRPRGGRWPAYHGPAWSYVRDALLWAWENDLSVLEAGCAWYSGAYLLETWPSVLYILMRHAGDPEEAIVRAVNDTKDNDTIAAVVGAAVGALHGKRALPRRWLEGLSGRTQQHDDGKVFHLLAQARRVFWEGAA